MNNGDSKQSSEIFCEKELAQKAQIAYQNDDINATERILEQTISLYPKNSFALGFLATIKKSLGFKEEALMLFRRSTLIAKTNADILNNYSGLLEEIDIKEALDMSNLAVNINPKSYYILERNGYLKFKSGDIQGAIETIRKSIEIKPENPTAHLNLGSIYKDLDNLQKALNYTHKSLELQSDNPYGYMNLGIIHKDLGNLDQALEYTFKSLELKPDNPDAHMNLGIIHKDLGNLDQALEYTFRSLELKPDNPDAHMNLSIIYKDLGKLDKALKSSLKALEIKPDHPDAHMNLGSIHRDLGNLDQALRATLKSIELKPKNPTAFMNLGSIYKDLGNLEQALASTMKSIELKPDNPTAHINLGTIHKNRGNMDQALSSTLKSIELQPDNPTAFMNLGGMYKDLGNLEQALASTMKSIELKPESPAAHMNLGGIYKDLGNLEQALASTLNSINLRDDDFNAYMNLGVIYEDLGEIDKALASTLKSLDLNPNSPAGLLNLGRIYENMNDQELALSSYIRSAEMTTEDQGGCCLTSLVSASIILLQMNRLEQAKRVLRNALKLQSKYASSSKDYDEKRKKHNIGYLLFLTQLMPKIPEIKQTVDSKILHLGESNCLAFANRETTLCGNKFVIIPSLVKGAKAYDLGKNTKMNSYKSAFTNRARSGLENFGYIFLSFGEIDCRENEGIIQHAQNNKDSIETISRNTAENYFTWTSGILSKYKQKLIYFGVPAPSKKGVLTQSTSEQTLCRVTAIKTFNKALMKKCKQAGILFADAYRLTANKDGFNNGKWMIDNVHMSPHALNSLITYSLKTLTQKKKT
jgi:tetratricopeptide (TPR) repeat protein